MYLDKIISEFPEQFKNKENIQVFVAAISRQLDELRAAFDDLKEKRSLDTAIGKQLDGIGDIVVLSRREAGLLAGKITFPVLDDVRYRKYLKYKVLKNTNICTYYDIINGLVMLYGTAIEPIYYYEDPDLPATIILEMPMLTPGTLPDTFGDIPPIKPAGVGFRVLYRIRAIIEIRSFVIFGMYEYWHCGPHLCGTLPWQYQIGKVIRSVVKAHVIVRAVQKLLDYAGTLVAPGEPWQYQIGNIVKHLIGLKAVMTDIQTSQPQSGTMLSGGAESQYQIGLIVDQVVKVLNNVQLTLSATAESGQEICGDGYVIAALVKGITEIDRTFRFGETTPNFSGDDICGKGLQISEIVKSITVMQNLTRFEDTQPGVSGETICGEDTISSTVKEAVTSDYVIRHAVVEPRYCGDMVCGINLEKGR